MKDRKQYGGRSSLVLPRLVGPGALPNLAIRGCVAPSDWQPRYAEYGYGILLGLIVQGNHDDSPPRLPFAYRGFGALTAAGPIVIRLTLAGFVIR
jgi:hypothetical protein